MKNRKIQHGTLLVNSISENCPAYPGLRIGDRFFFPEIRRASINRCVSHKSEKKRRQFLYSKPFYYLVFFSEGNGTVLLDDSVIEIRKGCLLPINPGQSHSLDALQGDTAIHDEVVFELKSMDGQICEAPWRDMLTAWFGHSCSVPDCGWELPEVLHSSIKQAFLEIGGGCSGIKSPFRLQYGLSQLMALLESHLAVTGNKDRPDPLKQAYNLILTDTAGLFTLTTLAEEVGLSANYLSRAFKDRYGITPMKLQINIRLQAAANLLQTSNIPIKAIAKDTGFSSTQHLIRMMKDWIGKTPGQLRNA